MKAATLFTVVGSFAAIVSAQIGLPSCANSCIGQLPKECSTFSVGCICSDKAFLSTLSCCVATKCSAEDQEATIKAAQKLCLTGGVTLGSTSAGCASTSAPAGGSSSTASAQSITSVASTGSVTGTGSITGTGSMTGSATAGAASSTTTPTSSVSTGGAMAFVGKGIGAAGAAVAALAML